ncbi:MAG TPA: hypothetical protein ENI87_11140 [bacterium]|nr:hypothetical protein [bacterium]
MCWLPLLLVVAQAGQEPSFVDGDVDALSCRVVKRADVDEGVALLTVRVDNRGAVDAEPLAFRITWRDRKTKQSVAQVFERARLPHVCRYGRPVPAHGRQSYVLRAVGLPRRVRPDVTVAVATFHENGQVPRFDLAPSKIESVQRSSLVGTFPVSQVKLHNPLPRAVEVLLRVTMVQPRDGHELFGVRLPAGETVTWTIASAPGAGSVFVDPETPPGCAMKATAIELIDWCLVGSPDAGAGAAMLREPYERWYRWPAGTGTLAGTFRYRGRRKQAAGVKSSATANPGYDEFHATGRFSVVRGGRVRVVVESGADAGVRTLLDRAFAGVLRPNFDELGRDTQFVPIAPERVALVGRGWDPNRRAARNLSTGSGAQRPELADYLVVAGGRITGQRGVVWQTRAIGEHYVRTRAEGESMIASWGWTEVAGRLVPNSYQSTTRFGEDVFESAAIELADLSFGGEELPAPAKPTGPGADALRALWDAPFRLTADPVTISAAFEVRTRGTDLVWRGEKKVRGTVTLRGLGRHLRQASFEFAPPRPAEREMALAAAVRDRWLIWWSRDFNDRQQFDEFFAGARIEGPDAAGDFTVHGHRITRVKTAAGAITGFVQPGLETTFTRGKAGTGPVTRIREQFGAAGGSSKARWTATVSIGWQEVAGVWVPAKLEFAGIFGKDWGPETIVLRNIEVR